MNFKCSPTVAALLVLVALALCPTSALAWVETRVLAHDARVELTRHGSAKIEHTVRLRVSGGPLRALDIRVADRNITTNADAQLTLANDSMAGSMPIPVSIEQRPDGDVRAEIDEGRGVRRGLYDLRFSYESDLLQQGAIVRDGAMLRVTWMGPRWDDGIDNVRVTFAVPASQTEPRAINDLQSPGVGLDPAQASFGAVISTLTRLPEFDELALIRPHVAKQEAVRWAVRIDPKALGELNDPRLQPVQAQVQPQPVAPQRRALLLAIGAIITVAYSIALAIKHHQVVQACKARGVRPKPLLPVGIAVRVALAGPLLALSVGAQLLLDNPTLGAGGIVGVLLLTAYLAPAAVSKPRGPGKWLPISEQDAFGHSAVSKRHFLDASTTAGKVTLVLALASFAGGVAWLARTSTYHAYILAFDVVVLFALLGTGRQSELPADMVRSSSPVLRKLAQALRRSKRLEGCRIKPIARVPMGAAEPDELRLTVRPRQPLKGLVALEVALAWTNRFGGAVAFPHVLVRVLEGSACEQALSKHLGSVRWQHGREGYERVAVLEPSIPNPDFTVALVEQLAQAVCVGCEKRAPAKSKRLESKAKREVTASSLTPQPDVPFVGSW